MVLQLAFCGSVSKQRAMRRKKYSCDIVKTSKKILLYESKRQLQKCVGEVVSETHLRSASPFWSVGMYLPRGVVRKIII